MSNEFQAKLCSRFPTNRYREVLWTMNRWKLVKKTCKVLFVVVSFWSPPMSLLLSHIGQFHTPFLLHVFKGCHLLAVFNGFFEKFYNALTIKTSHWSLARYRFFQAGKNSWKVAARHLFDPKPCMFFATKLRNCTLAKKNTMKPLVSL
jgi:hypothetical protein